MAAASSWIYAAGPPPVANPDGSLPWWLVKETNSEGEYWKCIVCNKQATPEHIGSQKHRERAPCALPMPEALAMCGPPAPPGPQPPAPPPPPPLPRLGGLWQQPAAASAWEPRPSAAAWEAAAWEPRRQTAAWGPWQQPRADAEGPQQPHAYAGGPLPHETLAIAQTPAAAEAEAATATACAAADVQHGVDAAAPQPRTSTSNTGGELPVTQRQFQILEDRVDALGQAVEGLTVLLGQLEIRLAPAQ